MPIQYEKIRDSYVARGKDLATAKKLAAMTFNSHRKAGVAPVTGHGEGLGDKLSAGKKGG